MQSIRSIKMMLATVTLALTIILGLAYGLAAGIVAAIIVMATIGYAACAELE